MTELEALGAVWAVNHFRPYLYGHICTDHEVLSKVFTQHPTSLREVGKMEVGTAGGGLAHPLLSWQEKCKY